MSSSIRIMHAGDLCLDGQFPISLPADADDRFIYQDATLKACEKLLYQCLQEQVDVLLITGNLFAEDRPTLRACLALQELFQELIREGVEILVAGPDQGACEQSDVAAFLPNKVQYIPLKQATPWKKEIVQGQFLQIGYRLTGTSDTRFWQIGLTPVPGKTVNWDQYTSTVDGQMILAAVGTNLEIEQHIDVSLPAPIQPHNFHKHGRPFIHLLSTSGHGWEIKEIQTAVIELRKKQIEVEHFASWDQILGAFQSRMNEENNEGLELVHYHWKVIGTGDLLESLLDQQRVTHLLEDLKRISPTYPRCIHKLDIIPVRKYREAEPTELEEIFHAAMFGEINTVGSSEPFTLPGLSPNLEDFVNQVADMDTDSLDEDHLFEQALKKGHQWLR